MSLPNKGALISLDLGRNRTGVAVSDAGQVIAFPRDEIEYKSNQELLEKLKKIIEKDSIKGVLMGLPLAMSGEETKQTQWTKKLAEEIKALGLPCQLMDERLTTQEAKKRSFKNEKNVDSYAAQILLETYFSSRK